jgi:hypothetical protein
MPAFIKLHCLKVSLITFRPHEVEVKRQILCKGNILSNKGKYAQ